ncbi:MAG: hypothetical protein HYT44_05395 [Nitrosarchaeum sp.]|nr:hypothetical protein [Nitrosarchaeum sp.]
MWKLDLDDEYFRIFDSNKLVAGYFDPDYGDIFPKENSAEIISQMLKNHDKISGGLVMIPLVKFGLFDSDLDIDIDELERHVNRVGEHLKKWKDFIAKTNNTVHSIRISHTDQDMLTITFPIKFSEPVPLDKTEILKEIFPILDLLQKLNLL